MTVYALRMQMPDGEDFDVALFEKREAAAEIQRHIKAHGYIAVVVPRVVITGTA